MPFQNSSPAHPSILKRLLVAIYDGFLILATAFFASALTLLLTGGEATSTNNIYMTLYLFAVIYIFYGWFWTHGGQTLGMRAWKQKLVQFDGSPVNWKQSFIRVLTGLPAWLLFIIGLSLYKVKLPESLSGIPEWSVVLCGFIWVLLDNRSNNWRDKLSGTHIILVNKADTKNQ